MKKLLVFVTVLMLGVGSCVTSVSASEALLSGEMVECASSGIHVATGLYKCGSKWIKVNTDWVRICDGVSDAVDVGFTAEEDPWGGTVLKLERGMGSITIASDGSSLYYDATYKRV